jgi:epsilon-lactone hydrolase
MGQQETQQVREIWGGLLAALAPPAELPEWREGFEELCATFPIPDDATIEAVDAGGAPCLLVRDATADGASTIVWTHSGGYAFGSANSYRSFGVALSKASGAQVLLVDYRLAPEHAYPAALDDAKAAYRWVLSGGADAGSVVLGGDSAGGGLAAATLLALKDDGDPLPAGVVVVSPFADHTFAGASMTERIDVDPIASKEMLDMLGGLYRVDAPPEHPYLSPIFGDWTGAPPLLAFVGTDEVLHDDAVRLVARATDAGVDAELVIGEGQAHIWPLFCSLLPEGQEAVEQIGRFVSARTSAVGSR